MNQLGRVVRIWALRDVEGQQGESISTGCLINATAVLTCAHGVSKATSISIRLEGGKRLLKLNAKLPVQMSSGSDAVVLELEPTKEQRTELEDFLAGLPKLRLGVAHPAQKYGSEAYPDGGAFQESKESTVTQPRHP